MSFKRLIGGLAVVMAMGSTCVVPAAGQNAEHAKVTDRDDLFGWEGVGRLDVHGKGICSAVLVSTDLVLTAAHCVMNSETRQPVSREALRFRAGFSRGEAIAEREVFRVLIHPDYDPQTQSQTDAVRSDLALLRLDHPIGVNLADPFAPYDGTLDPTQADNRLIVASYGRGRMNTLSVQRGCTLLDARDDLTFIDCDITFGSSGAPIFQIVAGRVRLVSLVSAMARMGGRKIGLGMALSDGVDDLKQLMARQPSPPPRSQIRRVQVQTVEDDTPRGAKFVKP